MVKERSHGHIRKLPLDREKLHWYYDRLTIGLCIVQANDEETILFANREACLLYDCATEAEFFSLTGGTFRGMTSEDSVSLANVVGSGGNQFTLHFQYLTASRHLHDADSIITLDEIDGRKVFFLHLVSQQMELANSISDELTGFLGGKDFFTASIDMSKTTRNNGNFPDYCPVCFNIANFRGFNRENGIDAGNRLLSYIAQTLRKTFSKGLFGHTNADTFLAILPRDGLGEKVEEACALVNRYIGSKSSALKAGVVMFGHDVSEEMVRHSFDMAKIACNAAKDDREHSYVVFSKEMEDRLEKRQYILEHFDLALKEGYIKLYYQPVVRTLSGKVCSFEALARWEDPERGMIMPGVFVPVLESARRIGRLDAYMIDHVVQSLHERLKSGLHLVPVSLNLSQLDFDLTDPLRCLEEAVAKYQVPRKYIHVEVTESGLAENRGQMARTIKAIHDAGYEVWLDDFGAEYSSLNVLHSYCFDLIKLDMGFFQNFDAKSRDIITGIVLMAKRMGLHVLAEGVETEEQLAFLKEIGCERIQGYYYGKPMPIASARSELGRKHILLESDLERSVYGAAGLVDIVSQTPIGLCLRENGTSRMLCVNQAFLAELKTVGIQSLEEYNKVLSVRNILLSRKLGYFMDQVFAGTTGTTTFVDNGQYLRMNVTKLSGVQDFWIGKVNLTNISFDQEATKNRRFDAMFRNVVQFFDGVYFLDLQKDEIEVVECVHPKIRPGFVFHGISSSFAAYTSELVHMDDRKRFLSFIDVEQLCRVADASERGYAQDLFRIRREDGTYRWTTFLALILSRGNEKGILLCERQDIWETYPQRKSLLPVFAASLSSGSESLDIQTPTWERSLLYAFLRFSGIPAFWKDRSLRFLGANEKLLAEIGKSRDEVLGKTAKELGIYIDADSFHSREERILRHGETLHDTRMILVDGVGRQLTVTEFPWYLGNEIAGTAGFLNVGRAHPEESFITDPETGLLDMYGILIAASAYDEAYRKSGTGYCGVYLTLKDYGHLCRTFGSGFTQAVTKIAAEELKRDGIPLGASASRLTGCDFLLLSKEPDSGLLVQLARKVRNRIQGIPEIGGISCHLEMSGSLAFGAEAQGFFDLLDLLYKRARHPEDNGMERLNSLWQMVGLSTEILNSLSDRVALIDPETNEILFLNRAMRKDLNLAEDSDCAGKKCYEILECRDTPCRFCPNSTLSASTFSIYQQKCKGSGQEYLVKGVLVPWKGRIVRLSIGHATGNQEHGTSSQSLLDYEMWANDAITEGMAEKDPSHGIQKAMEHLAFSMQADRFLLFEERPEQTVRCTYEWCRKGRLPVKEEMQGLLRKNLEPLYRIFTQKKVAMIPDYEEFLKRNPDFVLPIDGVRNIISGHLAVSGTSLGFTMVLNASDENFRPAGYMLATLTDFFAALLRNRNSLNEALQRSLHDPMTGVLNRGGLAQYLRERTFVGTVALISGDINGLKHMNDTQGHEAGDHLICSISKILVHLTDADHVVRMGGDEFLVIGEGMDDAGARNLIDQIKVSCLAQGLSLALGYTIHTGKIADIDAVLRKADEAMYEDKSLQREGLQGSVTAGQPDKTT